MCSHPLWQNSELLIKLSLKTAILDMNPERFQMDEKEYQELLYGNCIELSDFIGPVKHLY